MPPPHWTPGPPRVCWCTRTSGRLRSPRRCAGPGVSWWRPVTSRCRTWWPRSTHWRRRSRPPPRGRSRPSRWADRSARRSRFSEHPGGPVRFDRRPALRPPALPVGVQGGAEEGVEGPRHEWDPEEEEQPDPPGRAVDTATFHVLNYLCEGYKMFYKHVAPYMDFMKKEYMNQRPPANVMKEVDQIKRERLL